MSIRLRRRGRRRRRRLSRRRGGRKVAEEVRLRADQRPGLSVAEAVLVGLHGPVKREEFRIGAVGVGEDAVAFAVAFAANLLGLLLGLGGDDRHLAVGFGLDLLALLRPLGAVGRGALLPLGLHA